MDEFEYLAALVSVVAGLSLTRALSGYAKIVDSEKDIRLSGVHMAWTLSVILWLVGFWWFTFTLSFIETWTVSLLLFVLLYGAIIYFLIALLFPDRQGSSLDILENFISRRRPFFVAFVVLGLVDIADTVIKIKIYDIGGPSYITYYWTMMFLWVGLGIIGALTANRTFHRVFAYSWLVTTATWNVTSLVSL
jgi:hypothetical protein